MKKLILLSTAAVCTVAVCALVLLRGSTGIAAPATGGDKVYVCHNGHTIEISASALSAHLAHGDKLGGACDDCIDPSLINPDGICILIYSPVCGCDGVTYSNSCFATNAGVTSYTPGPCP